MRLLFILGFNNPFPGAGWTRIGFLANAWSKKNHVIEILGTFSYATLHKRGSKRWGNLPIFNLIFNMRINHPIFFIFNTTISFIVSTLFLLVKKPDVVVVSVPTGDVGLGGLMACRVLKTKFVVDYRDEWEDYISNISTDKKQKSFYYIVKQVATYLYSKSCLIATVTSIFSLNLKYRGLSKIALIPNGADITVFRQLIKSEARKKLNLSERDFIIVYSGLLGSYYKIEGVVKALVTIRRLIGAFKFIVVGQGNGLHNLKSLTKNLGLSDDVFYLGVKDDPHEIALILSASDIGIIPGVYTKGQLAVKFFEYCACSVPVIAVAPDDSIIANLINKYEVGLSVPSMDEIRLAKSIYTLYSDVSFRINAGKKARVLVEEKFDRNKTAEKYIELIKGVIIKC